jgi:hypothetical protein
MVTAAQGNNEKTMLEILGPDGTRIVSSGDEVEDASSRANFVEKYQEMHRLVKEPDGTTTFIHRSGELAHTDTARKPRRFVVFRHRSETGGPTPYQVYYFHILTRQGKNGQAARRIMS